MYFYIAYNEITLSEFCLIGIYTYNKQYKITFTHTVHDTLTILKYLYFLQQPTAVQSGVFVVFSPLCLFENLLLLDSFHMII